MTILFILTVFARNLLRKVAEEIYSNAIGNRFIAVNSGILHPTTVVTEMERYPKMENTSIISLLLILWTWTKSPELAVSEQQFSLEEILEWNLL